MSSLTSTVFQLYKEYSTKTPNKLKIIDSYLLYVFLTGVIQFVYCCLVGTFPFNSFLSGFISTVSSFVLGVCLRLQVNPENKSEFQDLSPERGFADFIFAQSLPITPETNKIVEDAKNIIDKALGDIGSTSPTKQIILGTASGWLSGYVAMKVGKLAAIGLGSGVILLHIAREKGYIDINWDKIHKKADKLNNAFEEKATEKSSAWFDKVITFFKSNTYYSAGFTGGFFFGIASS